jgi:hypothetical protein
MLISQKSMKTERRPLSYPVTYTKAPKAQGHQAGNRRTTQIRIEKEVLACQRGRWRARQACEDFASTGHVGPGALAGPSMRSIAEKLYELDSDLFSNCGVDWAL